MELSEERKKKAREECDIFMDNIEKYFDGSDPHRYACIVAIISSSNRSIEGATMQHVSREGLYSVKLESGEIINIRDYCARKLTSDKLEESEKLRNLAIAVLADPQWEIDLELMLYGEKKASVTK